MFERKKEKGKLQMETCISTCSEHTDFGNVFWKWQKNLYSANWTQLTHFELDPKIQYSSWSLKSIFGCTGDCRCLGSVCSCYNVVIAEEKTKEFLSLCISANRRSRKKCTGILFLPWLERKDSDQPVLENKAHEDDFSLETSIKFKWRKKPLNSQLRISGQFVFHFF